jgi:hypothetical protein
MPGNVSTRRGLRVCSAVAHSDSFIGMKKRALGIDRDVRIKFVQAWQTRWPDVRSVRISIWRRIISRISGVFNALRVAAPGGPRLLW